MEHTDWFVKAKDGGPFETPWGGTSLDMTQPGAREYVRKVAAQMVEKWENETLSGASRVAGGEPYELRIITPEDEKPWALTKAVTNPPVKTQFTQDGPRIGGTINSATSRDVSWRLEFSR